MKTIQLQIINDQDHTETTLINSKGDKFTFNPLKHEGLDSFLSGCKLASDGDLSDVRISLPQKKITEMKSIWTSVKDKWPEVLQRCVFYDPFSDFIGEGRFIGSGFLLNGIEYKGTHWIDIHKPSKSDIEDTIKWLQSGTKTKE